MQLQGSGHLFFFCPLCIYTPPLYSSTPILLFTSSLHSSSPWMPPLMASPQTWCLSLSLLGSCRLFFFAQDFMLHCTYSKQPLLGNSAEYTQIKFKHKLTPRLHTSQRRQMGLLMWYMCCCSGLINTDGHSIHKAFLLCKEEILMRHFFIASIWLYIMFKG